jgi:2-polyprenyl-6-hydroxyphenyl methylase/3-demethylubiquinone-9 3-methyltransferase
MQDQGCGDDGEFATVETFFDFQSPSWTSRASVGRRREIVERLVDRHIGHARRVLDAGCGSGVFTLLLARRGLDVVALDSSPEMIRVAEREVTRSLTPMSGSVTFKLGHLEQLEVPDTFDAVICLSVLEYVKDDLTVLKTLSAALASGGMLILSVPNARSVVRLVEARVGRVRPKQSAYLAFQQHQYVPAAIDQSLERLGLERKDAAYWSVGFSKPRFLVRALEWRWWAGMYVAVYVKDPRTGS